MDERTEYDELELDQAIDASRHASAAEDPAGLGGTVDRLRSFANSGPAVERLLVGRKIEERVDRTPQQYPWWNPRWARPATVGTAGRRLATGGAVAVVAVGISVAALLSSSGSASAAFLENVQALNTLTETATADGVIDDAESAAITALIEQLRAEARTGSLADLDPTDLAEALTVLHSIDDALDDLEGHDDDAIEEITHAVVSVIDPSEHADHEDGEHHEGDHDGDEDEHDTAYTQDQIDASLAALAQLAIDLDQLKLDADAALAETLNGFAALEPEIPEAQAAALALVAAIPDLPDLSGLSDDELKTLLADLGIVIDTEDDDHEGDHEGDDHEGDDYEGDDDHEGDEDHDGFDDVDADRLAAALVDQYFDGPDDEINQLLRDLRAALEDIEDQGKDLTEPFDEEFRYSRDDARELLHELKDYLDGLEADARIAEAQLENQLRDARTIVRAALNAKLGALLDLLAGRDGHEDDDHEARDHEDDDHESDDEHDDDEHDDHRDGDGEGDD